VLISLGRGYAYVWDETNLRCTLHQMEMGGDSIDISVHGRGRGGLSDLAVHLLRGVFFPILV